MQVCCGSPRAFMVSSTTAEEVPPDTTKPSSFPGHVMLIGAADADGYRGVIPGELHQKVPAWPQQLLCLLVWLIPSSGSGPVDAPGCPVMEEFVMESQAIGDNESAFPDVQRTYREMPDDDSKPGDQE
ncbi:hypothetical protein LEMLEM_LOCUS5764 [Lemmus lemmus]